MIISIFSDRFRTAINVFGDSIGCAIVQHLSRKELRVADENNSNNDIPPVASDTKPQTIYDSDNIVDRTHL